MLTVQEFQRWFHITVTIDCFREHILFPTPLPSGLHTVELRLLFLFSGSMYIIEPSVQPVSTVTTFRYKKTTKWFNNFYWHQRERIRQGKKGETLLSDLNFVIIDYGVKSSEIKDPQIPISWNISKYKFDSDFLLWSSINPYAEETSIVKSKATIFEELKTLGLWELKRNGFSLSFRQQFSPFSSSYFTRSLFSAPLGFSLL